MKLIVLDRDGVINEERDDYVKSANEWRPLDGSLEAIVKLKHHGFRVVVASNQSGLARGLFDYDALFAIHDKMMRMLAELGTHVDGIFFCPHAPDDRCHCRKPHAGMLEDIARRFGSSLRGVPFVGDRESDIEAATAVGAQPILVRSGKAHTPTDERQTNWPIHDDLAAAADFIIADDARRRSKKKN